MMSRLRLVLLGVLATFSPALAQAEIHFIDGQTQFDNFYPAEAILTVETPIGFVSTPGPTFGDPIYGSGGSAVFHTFTVTGKIRILSSDAKNSYIDPFSGAIGPVAAGNHVVQQELVTVSDVTVTSPTAAAGSLALGDGVADFIDSTPGAVPHSLFSTGGSAENSPGFTTAQGYLNIFLEVNITNPQISTPLGTFDIGLLHNNQALHLEATHSEYLPFGIPFLMANISGPADPLNPIPMFTRVDHPGALAIAAITGQPPKQQELARFTAAQITIFGTPVPEANSIVLGAFALLAFAGYAWRLNRIARPARA